MVPSNAHDVIFFFLTGTNQNQLATQACLDLLSGPLLSFLSLSVFCSLYPLISPPPSPGSDPFLSSSKYWYLGLLSSIQGRPSRATSVRVWDTLPSPVMIILGPFTTLAPQICSMERQRLGLPSAATAPGQGPKAESEVQSSRSRRHGGQCPGHSPFVVCRYSSLPTAVITRTARELDSLTSMPVSEATNSLDGQGSNSAS